jgi:hypothetical protein
LTGSSRALDIDQLLFRGHANAFNRNRGRVALGSALPFATPGVALALVPVAWLGPVECFLGSLTTGIGAVALVSFLWRAPERITDELLPQIAVHTAFAFTVLGASALLAIGDGHTSPTPFEHTPASPPPRSNMCSCRLGRRRLLTGSCGAFAIRRSNKKQ